MRKLALSLPLAALAALALGCAVEEPRVAQPVTSSGTPVRTTSGAPVVSYGAMPVRPVSGVVAPVATIRPGTGTVETVTAVPFVGSASTGGGSAGSASRLGIRMSDGSAQLVDYDGRDITVGSRVELTSDGFIRKL
ncbi:MAG TPA: hypothetical protein VEB41_08450 [Burkholderiales bacterium]|nr:hypothetical protein [Burkholderiales bacterium]